MALPEKAHGLIHVARRALGMTEDDYRAMLHRVGGVTSSTKLDDMGFRWVMDEFRRLGFESDAHRAGFGERRGDMATPGQVNYIRDLWAKCTDGEGTEKGLNTWLDNRFKVSALRFLDRKHASKAIAALTNWQKRKAARKERAA
jgi:phage gp16-like protein